MISALRVFGRSLGDLWFHLIPYVACNLVVAAGALFVPVLVASVLSTTGVPGNVLLVLVVLCAWVFGAPLLLGFVQLVAEGMTYRERPEVGQLIHNARARATAAWRLALIQAVGTLVLLVVFYFYLSVGATWALPLAMVSGMLGWTWLGAILYSGPLLVRSEAGVWTALRNGIVAMLRYPLFTSTLLLIWVPIFLVSVAIVPLVLLLTLALYSIMANRATNWVLIKEGLLAAPEVPAEDLG